MALPVGLCGLGDNALAPPGAVAILATEAEATAAPAEGLEERAAVEPLATTSPGTCETEELDESVWLGLCALRRARGVGLEQPLLRTNAPVCTGVATRAGITGGDGEIAALPPRGNTNGLVPLVRTGPAFGWLGVEEVRLFGGII